MSSRVTIRIFRGQDRRVNNYQEYRDIPRALPSILSALEYIRSHLDSTLVFQRSCWHGSCGTCSLMVNEVPALACTAPLGTEIITLSPLNSLALWGDLATSRQEFFFNFPDNAAYLSNRRGTKKRDAQPPTQQLENCIECGICESGCPLSNSFMGPAALSAHYRELINRPERAQEMLEAVAQERGVDGCQKHLICSRVCPAGVYPSGDIVQLKKRLEKESG